VSRSGGVPQNSELKSFGPGLRIPRRPVLRATGEIFETDFEANGKSSLGWKFIGKMFDNCALFEGETGMIVLNIRLAARKILFEQIRQNVHSDEQQWLLAPIDIQTSANEADAIDSLMDFFAKKNIEIYQSGKDHYRISSIPAWLSQNQVENFVRGVVQASLECDPDSGTGSVEENFAKIAAQHAKYEQYVTADEICGLAVELLKCERSSLGPNGEVTFFEIPKCDFLKRFPFL
jgi:DNA mismatch repair ATPase MutL